MKKQPIRLSDHFGYRRLFKFVFPSVIMTVFTSVYVIVDGVFVSNFAGDSAFAGLNLIFPALQILGAFGFMFGAGGSALLAKLMGEGNEKKARRVFSLLTLTIIIFGLVLGVAGIFAVPYISKLLGKNATAETVANGTLYGRLYLIGLPLWMLQCAFQSFFITAEKPKLGFTITVVAGIVNVVFDAVFIVGCNLGIAGAAIGTVLGQAVGGIFPLFYFAKKNKSLLRFSVPCFDGKALIKSASNGASELLSNISFSVVSMLYNFQLLHTVGEGGVIAYGVVMYASMVCFNIIYGYLIGMSPIVSFHYGANNRAELKNLKRKSIVVSVLCGVLFVAFSEGLAVPLTFIFVQDKALFDLSVTAVRICSVSFFFLGFGVFGSAFFTALNNGLISGALSFLRTFVFPCIFVFLLPVFWGVTGIWLSLTFAEFCSVLVIVFMLRLMKKKYGY